MRFISGLAFLLMATSVFARPLLPAQKLSDLNQLVGTIKSGYGPLKYKEQHLGLNIDMLAREYAEKIAASKTRLRHFFAVGSIFRLGINHLLKLIFIQNYHA